MSLLPNYSSNMCVGFVKVTQIAKKTSFTLASLLCVQPMIDGMQPTQWTTNTSDEC